MNTTQIKSILTENGYSTTANTKLDLIRFSCIFLDQEQNLYPDYRHKRFAFNYSDGYIEVYDGKIKNNTFVPESDIPNSIFAFDDIEGFIRTSKFDSMNIPEPFNF